MLIKDHTREREIRYQSLEIARGLKALLKSRVSLRLHWRVVDRKYFYFRNKFTFLLRIIHLEVIVVLNARNIFFLSYPKGGRYLS